MQGRQLGQHGPLVSALGLGCMGMTPIYARADPVDPAVPIEDTVGAMGRLVEAGKVGAIGLSEAGAQTISKAHTTWPLAAVQTEYSLATTDVEAEILPLCRRLGIGFVAYAPLSHGLLTGQITSLDQLGETDRRHDMPRFQPGNLEGNLKLVDALDDIAARHGVSNAAVAIAWVLSRGEDIVPIPGCSRRATLIDTLSALQVDLSGQDQNDIAAALASTTIAGTRYPEAQMRRLGL